MHWVLWLGVGVAAGRWLMEGIVTAYILNEDTFADEMGFTDPSELAFHLFASALIMLLAVVAHRAFVRSRAYDLAAAQLGRIVEVSDDAIVSAEVDGTIVSWNGGAEKIFGYTAAEAVGKPLRMLVPPQFDHSSESVVDRLAKGERVERYDTVRVRKDGQLVDVSISAAPIAGADGKVAGISFISQDISRAKDLARQQESAARVMERANRDLAKSNRNLEEFAYVASHDLQEPLRSITSFLQLLQKQYGDQLDERAREYIGYAVNGATRMRRLILDLLELSRVSKEQFNPKMVPFDRVVDQAERSLALQIEETRTKIVRRGAGPNVLADEGLLQQLLQNLLNNAMKFRTDAPPLIELEVEQRAADTLVSIKDNGIGIEDRFAERIFVVFQRLHTRERYEGTGIGLAICRRIVELHGGTIWYEPNPSGGSIFKFSLPASGGPA